MFVTSVAPSGVILLARG